MSQKTESALIAQNQSKSIIRHSTDTEFETPTKFYKRLCNFLNIFPVIDLCATEQNKKCKYYFSKKQDAFNFEWNYDFWANIPFGSKVTKINYKIPEERRKPLGYGLVGWMQRIIDQQEKYDTSGMVMLPLSSSIIAKFSNKCEIWNIEKRIKFFKNGVEDKFPISKDLMVLAFRSRQNIIDTYYSNLESAPKLNLRGGSIRV